MLKILKPVYEIVIKHTQDNNFVIAKSDYEIADIKAIYYMQLITYEKELKTTILQIQNKEIFRTETKKPTAIFYYVEPKKDNKTALRILIIDLKNNKVLKASYIYEIAHRGYYFLKEGKTVYLVDLERGKIKSFTVENANEINYFHEISFLEKGYVGVLDKMNNNGYIFDVNSKKNLTKVEIEGDRGFIVVDKNRKIPFIPMEGAEKLFYITKNGRKIILNTGKALILYDIESHREKEIITKNEYLIKFPFPDREYFIVEAKKKDKKILFFEKDEDIKNIELGNTEIVKYFDEKFVITKKENKFYLIISDTKERFDISAIVKRWETLFEQEKIKIKEVIKSRENLLLTMEISENFEEEKKILTVLQKEGNISIETEIQYAYMKEKTFRQIFNTENIRKVLRNLKKRKNMEEKMERNNIINRNV